MTNPCNLALILTLTAVMSLHAADDPQTAAVTAADDARIAAMKAAARPQLETPPFQRPALCPLHGRGRYERLF